MGEVEKLPEDSFIASDLKRSRLAKADKYDQIAKEGKEKLKEFADWLSFHGMESKGFPILTSEMLEMIEQSEQLAYEIQLEALEME